MKHPVKVYVGSIGAPSGNQLFALKSGDLRANIFHGRFPFRGKMAKTSRDSMPRPEKWRNDRRQTLSLTRFFCNCARVLAVVQFESCRNVFCDCRARMAGSSPAMTGGRAVPQSLFGVLFPSWPG